MVSEGVFSHFHGMSKVCTVEENDFTGFIIRERKGNNYWVLSSQRF